VVVVVSFQKKGKSYVSEISICISTNSASYPILHVRGLVRLTNLLTSSSQGRISGTSNPSPSSSFSRSSSSFSLASINLNRSSCAELSFLLLWSLCRASSSSSSGGGDGGDDEFRFGFEEGESEEEEGRPDRGLFEIALTGSSSTSSGKGAGGGGKKSSESSTMFNLEKYRSVFSARGSHQGPDSIGFDSPPSCKVRVDGMISDSRTPSCSEFRSA
jgi:hypothetical protein